MQKTRIHLSFKLVGICVLILAAQAAHAQVFEPVSSRVSSNGRPQTSISLQYSVFDWNALDTDGGGLLFTFNVPLKDFEVGGWFSGDRQSLNFFGNKFTADIGWGELHLGWFPGRTKRPYTFGFSTGVLASEIRGGGEKVKASWAEANLIGSGTTKRVSYGASVGLLTGLETEDIEADNGWSFGVSLGYRLSSRLDAVAGLWQMNLNNSTRIRRINAGLSYRF